MLCRGWAPDAGGVESHTQGLARALLAVGVRVEVLCTDRDPTRPAYTWGEWVVGGVRVRRMNLPGASPTNLESLDSDTQADARVREWLAQTQPDLVHIHHLSGFGFGALAEIERSGLSAIVSLHDYWTLCPRGQMFSANSESCTRVDPGVCSDCIAQTWPEMSPAPEAVSQRLERARQALGSARLLIVPSRAAADVLQGAGFGGLEFTCVPNGIDGDELAREVTRLRAGRPTGKRLGVIGAVQPSKGVLELAQALLQADVPGLVLDVHGPLSDYHGSAAYTEALADLARADERIRLHGPFRAPDLARVLASLDGLAAPSRWAEVFGLSAREARAVGLPVLAAGRAGLAEWEGAAGLTLVTGVGLEDWTRALSNFDFTPTAPEPLTSVETMAGEFLALYGAVCSEATAGAV